MSLSVCMITADPPGRVGAAIAPVRALADEILIAADSRVDAAYVDGYRVLADQVFLIEFQQTERHLAWLFEQCTGDWILRLDGDELPSAALALRLPDLLASHSAQQFWIARSWIWGDPPGVLTDGPWNEDFVNRLVRNDDALHMRGRQHQDPDPLWPREFVQEPIYHLDLAVNSLSARRDKVIRYESLRQGMRAAGGARMNEAFYLPELRASLPCRDLPAEDREMIARAVQARPLAPAAPRAAQPRLVTLQETDAHWDQRAVGEGAYRARIEPFVAPLTLAPSERRAAMFRVHNDGDEHWPGGLDRDPAIRLSYRWLNADGSVHTPEGPRTPFPRSVAPGSSLLVPLHVEAPATAGEYVIEVDVVHEDVRWFHCACRVPARVREPDELPPPGPRLDVTPSPSLRRWRRLHIPRVMHRVWLGSAPMPFEHERFASAFAEHHPDWEMRVWRDEDLPSLGIGEQERARARTHSELSNVVRYEVLHRHGGVYTDTDVECRRPLTPLLRGVRAFAALETPGRVGNAILGATPGHPVFARAAALARTTLGLGLHSPDANGPGFVSSIIEQDESVVIFPKELFYPYLWDEPERRHEHFPEAYAVHHWTLSWLREG